MAEKLEHQPGPEEEHDETAEEIIVAKAPADELTADEYGHVVETLQKIYGGLDTPEHHLAYVRERLAAARPEP